MTLEQLKYFIDVAETLNMTISSQKFYISPQWLSRSLKSLQQELDVNLLSFNKGKIELTQEGLLYYTKIKDLVSEINRANEEIKTKGNDKIKIAVSSYTYKMVSNLIEKYQLEHPNHLLIITEYPDKIAEEKLTYQKVDCAFISGPIFSRDLQSHILAEKEDYLLVSQNHPLSDKSSVSFEDIKNEPFIIMNDEHKIHDCYTTHMRGMSCSPKIIFNASSLSAMEEAMKIKQAVTLINPQYNLNINGFIKIPMRDKNKWKLSISIHQSNQSKSIHEFYHYMIHHQQELSLEY